MNEPTAYAELNPFTAIWTRPRETVRYVIEEKPTSFIVLLLVLTGFAGALSGASNGEEMFPAVGVILGALLLGPLAAVAGVAIMSGVYKLLGKLFGGVGTYSEMFRAVVTSSIPQIWLVPMWLIWLLTSPSTFYRTIEPSVAEPDTGLGMVIGLVLLLAAFFVGIWTFVIQCKGVGEAQRFSAWKGFFVIVIPALLIAFVIIFFLVFILFAVL
ncbi:YIP1 family protein [Planococcus sp. CP5-4]|uniref:Yip1 family protein n=1 Tax=unclassified Planococcus (in: firmicutes) TaxID=2662419 RepID=UPI001C215210|nr:MULTISPECIES: Yip1 family protein [unclassified Planococcus (in: firmicutes)]MBU9673297.1 YIP1 family protein [Planococcus sp. CP5-4_YE]MBV0908391.1 YIP1 family protein [Planococcus sp. CP5-4_UN]MBW6062605.1 YIP1 family protein [Planococcus sp. CP5-4]